MICKDLSELLSEKAVERALALIDRADRTEAVRRGQSAVYTGEMDTGLPQLTPISVCAPCERATGQ